MFEKTQFFFSRTAFQAWAKISLGELKAETSLTLNVICFFKKKSLILEQMENGLLTSDKGQHQEAWARWGHRSGRGANPRQAGRWLWSLGLPVQTTEEVPACHWL